MSSLGHDDIPRYKKKAKHSPPKKAKHKHEFMPCVLEFEVPRYDKQHGQVMVKDVRIDGYCPICGKIDRPHNWEHWWTHDVRYDGFSRAFLMQSSEAAKRELDPATRTLPTFWVDDWMFPKYVSLSGLELRTCYCPICDKHFEVRSNDSMGSCPDCGHHVVLHREGEE